jgi:hypothetical protein
LFTNTVSAINGDDNDDDGECAKNNNIKCDDETKRKKNTVDVGRGKREKTTHVFFGVTVWSNKCVMRELKQQESERENVNIM